MSFENKKKQNISQKEKILDLLSDKNWHCTSQMYAMYMSDPRRRLVDIKEMGYHLESRICQQHSFHKGGSKEWRLVKELKEVVLF